MMDNQHQPNQCLFPRLRNWSFLLGLLLVLAFPNQALANTLPTRMWDIPHTNSNSFTTTVLLPDWSQISLQNFPPIGSDGAIESLGRIWSAGQTPDQFWQLGDIEEALKAEILSLATIEQLALNGTDLDNLALAAFPLVGEQTISHLIEIVPNLAQLSLAEVAPLSSLASQVLGNGEIPSLGSIPLAEVVSQFPAFAAASLNQINLAEFALSEIPNLANVSLEQFSGWQGQLLRDIPNLNLVPLNSFPNPVTEAGTAVMRIDALYSQAEQRRHQTVSGSDVEGFAVACESNCAHIELDELENAGSRYRSSMEGKQWISGKYQQVSGGHGCLAGVNGGREPTGRHPFGSLFKVVVEEPDETTDTVETAMYFRFSNSCGHTPYFIGPVPFLSYRVNAPIFLGALPFDSMPPSSSSATQSIPTPEERSLSSAVIKPPSPRLNQTLVPATYIEGVDVVELASAISALDGSNNQSYQAVGAHVCLEGSSNCGAALGRYQLMSGDEAVRAAIASVSGGVEFLTRLDGGESVTPREVFQYFPPVAQERVFQESLAREVIATSRQFDPTTGAPFTGSRLVERVAQKHYGGAASRVDGDYTAVGGSHSLHSYGEGVVRLYQQRRGNNLVGEFSREKMTEISHVLLKVFLSFGLVKVPSLWVFEQKRRKYRFLLVLTLLLTVVIYWVF